MWSEPHLGETNHGTADACAARERSRSGSGFCVAPSGTRRPRCRGVPDASELAKRGARRRLRLQRGVDRQHRVRARARLQRYFPGKRQNAGGITISKRDGVKSRIDVDVGVEHDADAAELDEATLALRRELLELDVEDVERPADGPPPPGTSAVGAALVGTLVVTAAGELVSVVFRTVAGWIGRRPNRSVKLEIDRDSIEVTDPSAEDEQRLIEAFLARHVPNLS